MYQHLEPITVVHQWMDDAECVGYNPEWWFSEGKTHRSSETQMAIEICNECTVQVECLQYAMKQKMYDGIYGGLRGAQRVYLNQQLLRKARNGKSKGSNDG